MQTVVRRKSFKKVIIAAAVVVAAAGAWYFTRSDEQQASDQPLLARAEIGSIENTIASSGTLKPSHFIDVGAQVSGMLQKLHVEVGDVATEGMLLAEIDARVQEGKVQASRASIAAQEAQLEARIAALDLAKANAARQERLDAADATSKLEFDTSINNLASAQAGLEQLQKQIEQSKATLLSDETQLEFAKIFAPATGTVVTVEMDEGRTLNANQMAPNILRIADLSTMTVEAEISEADIGTVKVGMPVYFTTLGGGDRRWYGTLRQILPTPTVTNNVVLYTGLFDVENPDNALFSEMTAQVYFITSAAQNVLTVPVGALTYTEQAVPALAAAGAATVNAEGASAPGAGGPPPGFVPGAGGPPPGFVPGQGRPPGGFGGGAGRPGGRRAALAAAEPGVPRNATVTVVEDVGTREDRNVTVGVTSRVAAEVLSGLTVGEQVVAGIVQANAPAAPAQQGGFPGGGFPGGGGGFRGGF